MNERIHILITGERGSTLKFHFPRRKACIYTSFSVILLIALTFTSIFSFSWLTRNRTYTKELDELRTEVRTSKKLIAQLKHDANTERSRLNLQITSLKRRHANLLATFEEQKDQKDQLLSTAVNELNQRSELIDAMMAKIGVKVSTGSSSQKTPNSGGPFIALQPGLQGELLNKADTFLETIKSIPLGRPIRGSITSRFGPRKDPLNNKRSFHEGIDLKGWRGEKIHATAAGVVTRAFRNGSYGNFVEIDHKNGYKTTFGHMKKYTVAVGDKVKRGQLIGYVGNTGRSTGPHLHYEVLYKGKPVNPLKYLQVAKLTKPLTIKK